MKAILVLVEHAGGSPRRASLEAIGAVRAAGRDAIGILTGAGAADAAAKLGAGGASKAVAVEATGGFSADAFAADVVKACKEHGAGGLVAAATSSGKDIVARVAAHLDSVPFTDCTALAADGESFVVERPWLAGKAIAKLRCKSPFFCATTRLNVFAPATGSGACEVVKLAGSSEHKTEVVDLADKSGDKLDVKEAPVVVSGGRGLKDPSGFGILDDLADAFGNAAIGASRAVVDAGWRPHSEQVGQTGKTVAPQLYVAVGISGAIQHLAGMRTSKVIVAINRDADAPIFKVADYGIVGDAFEVVPALAKAVREIRAHR